MTNLVLETITSRSSIRAYKTEPLSKVHVEILIKAALAAPSARNMQPWSINVVQDSSIIEEWEKDINNYFIERNDQAVLELMKSRNFKVFYDAPCLFVIPINPENHYSKIDAGILVQNIALAAKSIGLDSVILGFPSVVFNSDKKAYWEKKLKFPEGYVYGISIAVGYADMHKDPHAYDYTKVVYIP